MNVSHILCSSQGSSAHHSAFSTFSFFRKLFSGKSKVSEQPGKKKNELYNLSPSSFPPLQPGALEKPGYQLCEPLCLTPGRHGLTAPVQLAASSHPPKSPRLTQVPALQERSCPHHSWRHPGLRACQGHLGPFDNLPHDPSSSYSCPSGSSGSRSGSSSPFPSPSFVGRAVHHCLLGWNPS